MALSAEEIRANLVRFAAAWSTYERGERAHRELDAVVARAYGWDPSVATDPLEIRARLVALHEQIRSGDIEYAPFG